MDNERSIKNPTPHHGISSAVPKSPNVTAQKSRTKLALGDWLVARRRIGVAARSPITAVPALMMPK